MVDPVFLLISSQDQTYRSKKLDSLLLLSQLESRIKSASKCQITSVLHRQKGFQRKRGKNTSSVGNNVPLTVLRAHSTIFGSSHFKNVTTKFPTTDKRMRDLKTIEIFYCQRKLVLLVSSLSHQPSLQHNWR